MIALLLSPTEAGNAGSIDLGPFDPILMTDYHYNHVTTGNEFDEFR